MSIQLLGKEFTTRALIFFGIIVVTVIISYLASGIYGKIKEFIDKLNMNKDKIEKIEKDLNIEKRFNNMEKRLSILEFLIKKKRADFIIDPRWIIIIILLVLFFLYLRSIGII